MTAYRFTSHRQLRDVLNNVESVQKKDINDFSKGHLNERKLYKPPLVDASGNSRIWKSSRRKKTVIKDSDLMLTSHKQSGGRQVTSQMKDILFEFSLGTTGSVPVPPPSKISTSPRQSKIREFQQEISNVSERKTVRETSAKSPTVTESVKSEKSLYSDLDDGVLVEELRNDELMMTSPRNPPAMYMAKKLSPSDDEYDIMKDLTQTLDQDGYLTVKHSFLPTFMSGVTKQDQFKRLKQFETSVLRKQDCQETKVLSGIKAVAHLEQRLQEELEMMNLNGMGPNFHKLQVFSNNFEDLIDETPTFGYMLKCIKSEYDNYITKLLDSQTPQHSRLLRDQVQQMSTRGTSRPKELTEAKDRVDRLEKEAKAMLEENQRLREQVKEEQEWLANAPEPEPPQLVVTSIFVDDIPVELADEIEHDKAMILEKLDALNDLRRKLRQEYVPLTVCTHLEQCIKETEIEVQKLLKQNEYFERSNNEMEAELRDSIQDADTSERDARRIWKKVNSLRGLPRVNLNSDEGALEDSDDEEDDETKWNWYIS